MKVLLLENKFVWYNNYRSMIWMKNKCFLLLIVVLCLFVFSGCNKNDKSKLTEGVDYKINGEFTGQYLDISKRGYYIDTLNQPDAPYFYIICTVFFEVFQIAIRLFSL